jgi:hypothetical protein
MKAVAKLRRKPKQFRSFTGLSVSEFDKLLTEFETAYEQARQEQQKRKLSMM